MKRLLQKDRRVYYYWFFDVMIVAMLALAIWNQVQLRDEARARQHAAYANCQASNDARQVVVNILMASEKLVNAAPSISPEQKKSSDIFYESQIKQIKFSDCSVYVVN